MMNPERRARISATLNGIPSPTPQSSHENYRSAAYAREARIKALGGKRNPKVSELNRQKIGAANPFFGKHHKPESVAKILASRQARGFNERLAVRNSDPDFQRRRLRACLKKPNKQELALGALLEGHFPTEWKYVGNGEVILGTKCPDFMNINGRKLLIELFGDYWHRHHDPKARQDYFEQYGFHTLVLWEKELKDPQAVVAKVAAFLKAP